MKKVLSLLALVVLPLTAIAADYQQDKHYVKVKEIAVKSPEVREFFSFYCPHCYRYEPLMAKIKQSLPEGVTFERNHVDFLPGASRKMQQMLTKALITAEKMENTENHIAAIFKYIHEHRAVFTSLRDVRRVFVLNGADGDEFERIMASEEVQAAADEMKNKQDALAKSGDLRSVPSVLVNGKYMVHTHDLDNSSFEALQADYLNLVKYLMTLD